MCSLSVLTYPSSGSVSSSSSSSSSSNDNSDDSNLDELPYYQVHVIVDVEH